MFVKKYCECKNCSKSITDGSLFVKYKYFYAYRCPYCNRLNYLTTIPIPKIEYPRKRWNIQMKPQNFLWMSSIIKLHLEKKYSVYQSKISCSLYFNDGYIRVSDHKPSPEYEKSVFINTKEELLNIIKIIETYD